VNAILNLILPVLLGAASGVASGVGESPAPAADAELPTPSTNAITVRSVCGRAFYWDGNAWARIRPNMVFNRNPLIRPDAESTVDLSADNQLALRLVTDRGLKVTAFVVRHVASQNSNADSTHSAAPQAFQIQAGSVVRGPGEIEFAVCANGNVQVNAGEVTVTRDGKTHLVEDNAYFNAATGEVRRQVTPQQADGRGESSKILSCSIAPTPRPTLFAVGLENARRGAYLAGQ
jgi:hypothetical protein